MQLAALAAADLGLKRPIGMTLKAAVKVLLTKRGLRRARLHPTVLERRNADPLPGHGSVPDHVRRSTRPRGSWAGARSRREATLHNDGSRRAPRPPPGRGTGLGLDTLLP